MKKVLFIGDIHGKSEWIKYAQEAERAAIEIVFLGDYVDSFDIPPNKIEQNLLRIIAFKKKADRRKAWKVPVTLLLGNHDYAYIHDDIYCSGFNTSWAPTYKRIFEDNKDLFQIAWGHRGERYTLATHAGITRTYWKKYIDDPGSEHYSFVKNILGDDAFESRDPHEILNVLKNKKDLIAKVGSARGGIGVPGVLWADIDELKKDPELWYNQIVGHTGWHSPEFFLINHPSPLFILKIDGIGDVQRMLVTLK